jgi:competence protein ComEC
MEWSACVGVAAWSALWWWRQTLVCWGAVLAVFFFLHTVENRHSPGILLAGELGGNPCAVRVRGVVVDDPVALPGRAARPGGSRFRLRVETLWRCVEDGEPMEVARARNAEVWVEWRGPVPEYGWFLEMEGESRRVEHARNPGEFDRAEWLGRRGILTEIHVRSVRDGQVLGAGRGGWVGERLVAARRWARGRLEVGVEGGLKQTAGVVESMVLGLRGEMGPEVREWFRETGTLHLFAVSGQNVMLLMLILGVAFRGIRVPRVPGAWAMLGILAGYALVTGGSPSCVRAAVMGGLLVGTGLVDRPPVLYNSLAAGALVILGVDTRQLLDLGFQLSFLQVLVLAWGVTRLERVLEPMGVPDVFLPRRLWTRLQVWRAGAWRLACGVVAVAVTGWVGALPVSLAVFHLWSPAGLLANVYVVPFASLLLAVGLLSLGVGWVADPLGGVLNRLNGLWVRMLLAGLERCAELPGGHAYVGFPRIPAPEWELTVFDLGDGGAAHLRVAGLDWLVDCGSGAGFRRVVLPALRERGVDGVTGLLLTHGDMEHIGGGLDAVRQLNPAEIGVGPSRERSSSMRFLHAELGRWGRGFAFYRAGDRIELGVGAYLEVLYPPAGLECSSADDRAMVCRLMTPCGRVLLSSDAGFWTEQWLLERGVDVAADLWILGRNARDPGGGREFLAAVNPVAVVYPGGGGVREAGVGGRFPGCTEFRMDRTGAVEVVGCAGGWLELKGYLNGQRLRSLAR